MDSASVFNKVLQEDEARKQAELEEKRKQEQLNTEAEAAAAPKDVKDYNLGDNIKEGAGAIVGGGIDIVNSVGSLPKLFDKRFYQATDPENPYEFDAPWIIKAKPITRTRWGGFIRGGTELIGGMIGTGKVLWGIKGLKGLATAARATRVGRVGLGAIQGGTYDVISNQSQEQNLARTLIDIKPQWAGVLKPIATKEDMSPALKSVYNVGEGLGIGGIFDIAIEAGGWGLRSYSISSKKAAKKISKNQDPIAKAVDDSSDVDYGSKTLKIEVEARKAYERSLYRKLKNKGKVDTDITTWRKKTRAFDNLPKEKQQDLMQLYADKNDLDWGSYRDMNLRATRQNKANKDLAIEQLEFDLSTGTPRENPAYYKGGDVTDNQALSSSSMPVKGVRDMMEIRNNFSQKYGSPRGTLTEAFIRRATYGKPGMLTQERNSLAKVLQADPAYQKIHGTTASKAIEEDIASAGADLIRFVSESGNSRLIDVPQEDVIKYIRSKDPDKETIIEGFKSSIDGLGSLNRSQLVATDTILGQLLYESRDLAKAALSVADEVDILADGSMLDGILARYADVARLRKETSLLSSFELKKFKSQGKLKDTIDAADIRGKASDAAAEEVTTFKQLLKSDIDDDLLESFIHFTATGNGNKQTWKDMQTFFNRKLHGYREGSKYQRNAILNELQTMGVNSMLSGPKTPVRALVGTGLQTVMRPVATILGSVGKSNDRVTKGAFQTLGAMVEARHDAWRKAVADFQSYNIHEEGWRGFTNSTADQEWQGMMKYFDEFGTDGEKASALFANSLREINRLPIFNYGTRVMKSLDTYFTQLIARGRVRQLAFDDVWTRATETGEILSDTDLDNLVRASEVDFEGKVFSADGQITDEMVKFSADEAKLTAELTGFAKDLDKVFEKQPFLRPFFLFARTGVNALYMTSKYTPGINRIIKENVDIMTKAFDDPVMIKYGIKSQADLEIAQSVIRGREAIGYGVVSTAALMALNGQITGNGPPDRGLRNSWIQSGKWQPRSIKIGGVYVSYEALEPFNMFFSFAADVVDAQKVMGDEWAANEFGKLSYLISANVTNKTFLAGLLQLQDLLTSQGNDAPRVAANFVNNQIPLSGMRNEIGKLLSPGMRELESGFFQSIGNRNLWADVITPGEMLPYRYDILNGEKIRDWDPVTRLVNGVLPFNINVGTNRTRELLMRSGINLKQTFNTGPNGESLEGNPDIKAKYQFYMGQQNIEAQLEQALTPQLVESIQSMERKRDQGMVFDARKGGVHAPIIEQIFRTAKTNAWQMLLQDPKIGGRADRLGYLHKLRALGDQKRIIGDDAGSMNVYKQIEKLEKKPIK